MKSLRTSFGVDYEQWKALTIAALKLDFRTSSYARRGRGTSSSARMIIGQVMLYSISGAVMAFAVAVLGDRFVAGIIVTSYVFLMVGMAMLVDHNATVISPTDYATLGFLPITSRTYFAARVTNVLVYTLGATTALAWLPVIAFFIRHGAAVGLAAAIAIYACSMTVTLIVVAGYLWLVRRFGTRRLQSLVSYLQLVTGFLIYGGFFAVSQLTSTSTLATLQLERTFWLLLLPFTWFASYLDLAAGQFGVLETFPALASVALLAFLAWKLRGRLSLEYAEQLAALTTAATPVVPRSSAGTSRPSRWFRHGEARAVAILVRSHFRNDLKFRMGVLGIVPITLIYLFMGLRNGGAEGTDVGRLSMVTIAVILFPTMLKLNMARSDAFRASWIFFATPADRTRLVNASTNVLVMFFVLPYLMLIGFTLAWFTESSAFLSVYLLLAGLISHACLLLLTCVEPELPFAKPIAKGTGGSRMFGAWIIVGLGAAFVPLLSDLIYESTMAIAITIGVVVLLDVVLHRIMRARIEGRTREMEFVG